MPEVYMKLPCAANDKLHSDLDVVVIGNGPSGISLSYMLSGWTPYFTPRGLPDDDMVQMRLYTANADTPLTELDLQALSEGLEGRTSNPVALLFDHLSHPYADMGLNIPSQLQWRYRPDRALSHLVIGKCSRPGGVWQSIRGDMKTLSKASWMELPNLTYNQYLNERGNKDARPGDRASVNDLRGYYEHYVTVNKLGDNFLNNSLITSIEKVSSTIDKTNDKGDQMSYQASEIWEVSGCIFDEDNPGKVLDTFTIRAKNVVLAVGTSDVPKRLKIEGEEIASYIRHSASDMQATFEGINADETVLVVGSGLSASDAILEANRRHLNVVHVFRDTPCGSPAHMKKRLPRSIYPEYVSMYELMCGDRHADWYKSYAGHSVERFLENGKVVLAELDNADSKEIVDVCLALIQIGSSPDLDFLPAQGMGLGVVPTKKVDSRHNPIDVNLFTYESVTEKNLYAMGPLVADQFVRFVTGGAFAITKHIQQKAGMLPSP